MAERERGLRDLVSDVCALLRLPDEEYDRLYPEPSRVAHLTAGTIEDWYRSGVRIARLLRWDSTTNPVAP
jgi:hypothetical protein